MVYLLIQHFIEDTDIVGVFTTNGLAEKARSDIEQIREKKYYSYEIQEWKMQQLRIDYQ